VLRAVGRKGKRGCNGPIIADFGVNIAKYFYYEKFKQKDAKDAKSFLIASLLSPLPLCLKS
jgi:hypothetical protein